MSASGQTYSVSIKNCLRYNNVTFIEVTFDIDASAKKPVFTHGSSDISYVSGGQTRTLRWRFVERLTDVKNFLTKNKFFQNSNIF